MKHLRGVLVVCLLASPVFAANRAFVSGTGIDTGTCPISSPCRGFAYALTQVTSGGEIIALDTAGYGSATISMAVSIIAPAGVNAFATAASGNVITVTAGMTDVVTLRGITVTGNGSTNGVVFTTGLTLNLENCFVNGHITGVELGRAADTTRPSVQIYHCVVANNVYGLDLSDIGPLLSSRGTVRPLIAIAGPPLVYATVKDSAFFTNSYGILARGDSNITVTDTVIAGNTTYGLNAVGSDGHPSIVSLDRCTISRNAYGIAAGESSGSQLPHGIVQLAYCQITGNDIGINSTSDGQILSLISNSVVTNTIINNNSSGTPTGNYAAE